jgi:hypothetical protein
MDEEEDDDPKKGSLRLWFAYRAFAYFEAPWRTCRHKECSARQRCCFGPRGTFRRTGGIPICRTGGEHSEWRANIRNLRRKGREERRRLEAKHARWQKEVEAGRQSGRMPLDYDPPDLVMDDEVGNGIEFSRFAVDNRQHGAGPPGVQRQHRGGVDDERGAERDE